MKTLKGFFLTTVCVFCLTGGCYSSICAQEQTSVITPEAVPTVTPVPKPTAVPKKKGLVKEGKKLCFYYSNGSKAKNKLKTVNGATYYFGPDGYAVCGGVRFKDKNKVYVFGENFKRIKNKKGKIIRVRYSIYYMTAITEKQLPDSLFIKITFITEVREESCTRIDPWPTGTILQPPVQPRKIRMRC